MIAVGALGSRIVRERTFIAQSTLKMNDCSLSLTTRRLDQRSYRPKSRLSQSHRPRSDRPKSLPTSVGRTAARDLCTKGRERVISFTFRVGMLCISAAINNRASEGPTRRRELPSVGDIPLPSSGADHQGQGDRKILVGPPSDRLKIIQQPDPVELFRVHAKPPCRASRESPAPRRLGGRRGTWRAQHFPARGVHRGERNWQLFG
jgi:hypothetical protein